MKKKALPVGIILLGLSLLISCGNPASETPATSDTTYTTAPSVVSAKFSDGSTVNNATNVANTVTSIDITFDQNMETGWSIKRNDKFLTYTCQWTDTKTVRVTFTSELSKGFAYSLILNPTGCTNPFKNTSGIALVSTTLAFTVTPYTTAPSVVSATFSSGDSAIGGTNIPSNVTFLDVVFDQRMSDGYSNGNNDTSLTSTPATWQNRTTIRISFPSGLTPNFSYNFYLNMTGHQNYMNTSGIALPDTTLTFSTGS